MRILIRGLAGLAALGVCVLNAATTNEIFSADRFTMLNVVPFSPGREDVAARDVLEYQARTGQDIVLYSLSLHPEGVPAMEKVDASVASYRVFAQKLAGGKVRPGILLQAILGHWPRVDKDNEPWQRTVNIRGDRVRYCPLDPDFRAYIRETAQKLAMERPCLILSDDDVRAFSPEAECFCPLHTAEFNRRTGRSLTPDQFRAHVANGGDKDVFDALMRETTAGVCALIREGIDSVDPTIPVGACQPGVPLEQARAPFYAQTIAAAGQAPVLRLANGQYLETTPKADLPSRFVETQALSLFASRDVPVLLDEADTWPHNPWAKSAAAFHAKLVSSAFIGLKGAKLWFVNCHKGPDAVSRNYTDVLSEHAGYYGAVAKAVLRSRFAGVAIPNSPDFPAVRPTPWGAEGWARNVFGAFGVPFFVTQDFSQDAVYALSGESDVGRLTQRQLEDLLSHRLLLDGDAAAVFVRRGYAADIGIAGVSSAAAFTAERDETTGDLITYPSTCPAFSFEPVKEARVLTSLVWQPYGGAPTFERVAPAAVSFENRRGGHVVVTSYNMRMGDAYTWSEGRKAWLERMLAALNGGVPLDNVVENGQNAATFLRRGENDDELVLVYNLNYDPLHAPVLRHAERPVRVDMLDRHGNWVSPEWTWTKGSLRILETLPCYGERIFRIRKRADGPMPE